MGSRQRLPGCCFPPRAAKRIDWHVSPPPDRASCELRLCLASVGMGQGHCLGSHDLACRPCPVTPGNFQSRSFLRRRSPCICTGYGEGGNASRRHLTPLLQTSENRRRAPRLCHLLEGSLRALSVDLVARGAGRSQPWQLCGQSRPRFLPACNVKRSFYIGVYGCKRRLPWI